MRKLLWIRKARGAAWLGAHLMLEHSSVNIKQLLINFTRHSKKVKSNQDQGEKRWKFFLRSSPWKLLKGRRKEENEFVAGLPPRGLSPNLNLCRIVLTYESVSFAL